MNSAHTCGFVSIRSYVSISCWPVSSGTCSSVVNADHPTGPFGQWTCPEFAVCAPISRFGGFASMALTVRRLVCRLEDVRLAGVELALDAPDDPPAGSGGHHTFEGLDAQAIIDALDRSLADRVGPEVYGQHRLRLREPLHGLDDDGLLAVAGH
jgi:hypothetical protein